MAWINERLPARTQPSVDGILFEPVSGLAEECVCERCRGLGRFEMDTLMTSIVANRLAEARPGLPLMLHYNASPKPRWWNGAPCTRREMSLGLAGLPASVRHIFGWLTDMTGEETDTEESLVDWLDADSRFQPYTRLSRVILYPDGAMPTESAEHRVARAFRWARLAAERGKTACSYDWRLFGGTEWAGHESEAPTTRECRRLPASLALMGETMCNPFLDAAGQRDLLERLRAGCEWDLDSPEAFYRGI